MFTARIGAEAEEQREKQPQEPLAEFSNEGKQAARALLQDKGILR